MSDDSERELAAARAREAAADAKAAQEQKEAEEAAAKADAEKAAQEDKYKKRTDFYIYLSLADTKVIGGHALDVVESMMPGEIKRICPYDSDEA